MAGWPSAWSGSAVLVNLPSHAFFVPCYLSAFQLLLIQTSSSVAGMEFDPIAVDIVISNLKKKNKQWEWEKACSNYPAFFLFCWAQPTSGKEIGPRDLKPLYCSLI